MSKMTKCETCDGMEYKVEHTETGIKLSCWNCGDYILAKELACVVFGHTVSVEVAQNLSEANNRAKSHCTRCDYPIIVRQNPKDKTTYFITTYNKMV